MDVRHVTSTSSNDQLFVLIKSLGKSEKRHFKLYVNRIQSKGDVKFIQLFDILDKLDDYDEMQIFKRVKGITKNQLPNLKRHLYKQILTSLRLIHIQRNVDIQIREQIDHARILYGKGLYLQSLRLLDRIQTTAAEHHQDLLLMEILEFQKLIEERHITRSRRVKGKVESLLDSASLRSKVIANSCRLSNLKIKIHGWYIQIGHIKNEKDRMVVEEYFKSNLPDISGKLTFFEEVYLYQSYVWYYYILLDFKNCYKYASRWVNLFKTRANMREMDADLYMRGLHYVLTALYYLKDYNKFISFLEEFEEFESTHTKQLSTLSKTIAFLYIYTSKMNRHFLEGSFQEGEALIPVTLKLIKRYDRYLDPHRILLFYYKIAYMYMGAGKPDKALDFLNKITDLKTGHLREDIQSYARLMLLIAHYELEHYDLLEYLISSTYRFLEKVEELNKVQRATLAFFRRLLKVRKEEEAKEIRHFHQELAKLRKDPYEKRAFLYLDVFSWAESRMKKVGLAEVITLQFAKKNKTP